MSHSVLSSLLCLVVPALSASVTDLEAALELADHGMRVDAWTALGEQVVGAESDAATVDSELASALFMRLTQELDTWAEARALLERRRSQGQPTLASFYADYTYALALWNLGEVGLARDVARSLGYFNDYLVLGPFDNERGGGMDTAYPPESSFALDEPVEGKERDVFWRPNPVPEHPLQRVLLDQMLRPDEQVLAYLATALESDRERFVALRLGSSGAVRIFLNGEECFAHDVERPHFPDQDTVVLGLRAGWNQLLIKTGVEDGGWSIETRLTELDGTPLTLPVDAERVALGSDPVAGERPRAITLRGRLEGAAGSARDERRLVLYHLLVHPEDRVSKLPQEVAARAVASEPDSVLGRYLLARVLAPRALSRAEISIQPHLAALDEVIAADPTHVAALLDRASFARNLNPTPFAADEWTRRAVTAGPDDWGALFARAGHLDARGRDTEAAELRLAARDSSEGRTRTAAARMRAAEALARGRRDEQLRELEAAFLRAAGDRLTYRRLLDAYLELDQVEEARRVTQRHFDSIPFSVAARTASARRFEDAGYLDDAWRQLERAYAIAPEDRSVLLGLARIDERRGAHESAGAWLDELLAIDPGDDRVRRHRDLLRSDDVAQRFEDAWRRDARRFVDTPLPDRGANDAVEVLERTTVYNLYEDGAESRYEHTVFRVLNLAGIQALDTYALSYPQGARMQVLNVRVIRSDGTVERAPVPRRRDRPRGQSFVRAFDLPALRVGDLIDVEYRVDETEPDVFGEYFGTRHTFYPQRIDSLAPTRFSQLVVIAPRTVPLHSTLSDGSELEHSRATDAEGRTTLTWIARDLERPNLESRMPPRDELVPTVDVTTFADWQAFASWWWDLIEKEFVSTPQMRSKVEGLTAGLETEQQKIAAIVRFVGQEIRYNAWPFGTHGYEPYSASTIFERRFGDCKDKSILLRQMLGEIGVEAWPVLIRARYDRPLQNLEAAMVEHFNHCIAYLPATETRDGYYVDATADLNPLEYLRADDQGAVVLHVTSTGGELHEIPYAPAQANRIQRSYDVYLDADGGARVVMVDESVGSFGVQIRQRYGGEQGALAQKLARALRSSFGDIEVVHATASDLEDISLPARLEVEFTARDVWTEQGSERGLRLSFVPLGLDSWAVEAPAERTQPVLFDRPFGVDTTIRWHLPAGATLVEAPPDGTIEAPGLLEHDLKTSTEGDVVSVRRNFRLLGRRIPVERYAEFRDAVQEARIVEQRTLRVAPKEAR